MPLVYNEDIKIIKSELEKIKEEEEIFSDFIGNYFYKYKLQFFISGEYNYSELPIDCDSNSYLENYNLFLKINLGRKYNLNWNLFITF